MYNVSAFPKTKHTAVLYYFRVQCIFVAKSNTISYVVIRIVFVLFVLHKLSFFLRELVVSSVNGLPPINLLTELHSHWVADSLDISDLLLIIC